MASAITCYATSELNGLDLQNICAEEVNISSRNANKQKQHLNNGPTRTRLCKFCVTMGYPPKVIPRVERSATGSPSSEQPRGVPRDNSQLILPVAEYVHIQSIFLIFQGVGVLLVTSSSILRLMAPRRMASRCCASSSSRARHSAVSRLICSVLLSTKESGRP